MSSVTGGLVSGCAFALPLNIPILTLSMLLKIGQKCIVINEIATWSLDVGQAKH